MSSLTRAIVVYLGGFVCAAVFAFLMISSPSSGNGVVGSVVFLALIAGFVPTAVIWGIVVAILWFVGLFGRD